MFITFEGIDGCGKTTQIRYLTDFLEQNGFEVVATREPGGTDFSEQLRDILLHSKHKISPISELFLFNAARAHLVETLILPAIKNNKVVISDRFYDSTLAYQGYGRGLNKEDIEKCNEIIKQMGAIPNVTFLLDISTEDALQRREGERKDRIESADINFFEKVRNGYLKIAEQEPNRVKIINASQEKHETFEKIKKIIQEIMKI